MDFSNKLINITLLIFLSLSIGYFFGKNQNTVLATNVSGNKIAIVDQDLTQKYNEKYLRMSNTLIDNLNKIKKYKFEVVTAAKAEQGMKNNYYIAKIVIPSNFTLNVLTVNEQIPTKVEIQYEINSSLSGERKYELEKDFNYGMYVINNSLNYIYTYGIMEGIHKSQEYVDNVLSRNKNTINYFDEITQIDLLANHDYETKELNDEESKSVDLSKEQEEQKELYEKYTDELLKNIDDYQVGNEKVNTSIQEVVEQSQNINEYLETKSTSLKDRLKAISIENNFVDPQKMYKSEHDVFEKYIKMNKKINKIIYLLKVNGEPIYKFFKSFNSSNDETPKYMKVYMGYNNYLVGLESCTKTDAGNIAEITQKQECIQNVNDTSVDYQKFLDKKLKDIEDLKNNDYNPKETIEKWNQKTDEKIERMTKVPKKIDKAIIKIKDFVKKIDNVLKDIDGDGVSEVQYEYLLSVEELKELSKTVIDKNGEMRFSYDSDTQELTYKTDEGDKLEVNSEIDIKTIFKNTCPKINQQDSKNFLICSIIGNFDEQNSYVNKAKNHLESSSTFFDTSFSEEEPKGGFINIDDPTLDSGKTTPENVFAYYTGFYYCTDNKGNYEYALKGQTCGETLPAPLANHFTGIDDTNQLLKVTLKLISPIFKLYPELKMIEQEPYQEEESKIIEIMNTKIGDIQIQNNELLNKKIDVYDQNQTAMEKYISEVESDPAYENLINKLTINQVNDNSNSSEDLKALKETLPNSKVENSNNLVLYNFLSNPFGLKKFNSSNKNQILSGSQKSNENMISLIVFAIALFIAILIVVKLLPYLKEKKEGDLDE